MPRVCGSTRSGDSATRPRARSWSRLIAAAQTVRLSRLCKVELQRLADQTGLTFQVCHYPPGTSKWNRIEHRMFCHISQNWRGTPLTSHLTVIELIAKTSTTAGLTIRCELDANTYPKGIKVPDDEMATLNLKGDEFHPDWNYSISPRDQIVEC
jgi:hypothetical protein